MNSLTSILIMFLVAALNTFIVVIVVQLIFKIKTNKKEISDQVKAELTAELHKTENAEVRKKDITKEQINTTAEINGKRESEIPEAGKKHPKFLMYTSKGYISPENDVKMKKHVWR